MRMEIGMANHCWHPTGHGYSNGWGSFSDLRCCRSGIYAVTYLAAQAPDGHGIYAPEVLKPQGIRKTWNSVTGEPGEEVGPCLGSEA